MEGFPRNWMRKAEWDRTGLTESPRGKFCQEGRENYVSIQLRISYLTDRLQFF